MGTEYLQIEFKATPWRSSRQRPTVKLLSSFSGQRNFPIYLAVTKKPHTIIRRTYTTPMTDHPLSCIQAYTLSFRINPTLETPLSFVNKNTGRQSYRRYRRLGTLRRPTLRPPPRTRPPWGGRNARTIVLSAVLPVHLGLLVFPSRCEGRLRRPRCHEPHTGQQADVEGRAVQERNLRHRSSALGT